MINLKTLSKSELVQYVISWKQPTYRASQIWAWMYQKNVTDVDLMTNLPTQLRQKLKSEVWISQANLKTQSESKSDQSTKFLLEVANSESVEAVLMPDGNRNTICLSSQVGCAMNCAFCATGQMGFFRNLPVDGIIDQFLAIKKQFLTTQITNVVFMGMGEPLANYQQVVSAVRILTDPDGIGMSPKRITISTVGLVPRIYQLAREGLGCKLALSLNGTNDKIRAKLMPINHSYPIDQLLSALRSWVEITQTPATIEYVLIKGINDSLTEAEDLCRLLKGLRCKINLIPFNPISGSDLRRPEVSQIEDFRDILTQHHRVAPIRYSKGRDIAAACGQLRTVYEKTGKRLSPNPQKD